MVIQPALEVLGVIPAALYHHLLHNCCRDAGYWLPMAVGVKMLLEHPGLLNHWVKVFPQDVVEDCRVIGVALDQRGHMSTVIQYFLNNHVSWLLSLRLSRVLFRCLPASHTPRESGEFEHLQYGKVPVFGNF